MIDVDQETCMYCGGCTPVCPVNVIVVHPSRLVVLDGCIDCEACVKACPVGALSLPAGESAHRSHIHGDGAGHAEVNGP